MRELAINSSVYGSLVPGCHLVVKSVEHGVFLAAFAIDVLFAESCGIGIDDVAPVASNKQVIAVGVGAL